MKLTTSLNLCRPDTIFAYVWISLIIEKFENIQFNRVTPFIIYVFVVCNVTSSKMSLFPQINSMDRIRDPVVTVMFSSVISFLPYLPPVATLAKRNWLQIVFCKISSGKY